MLISITLYLTHPIMIVSTLIICYDYFHVYQHLFIYLLSSILLMLIVICDGLVVIGTCCLNYVLSKMLLLI